MQVKQQHTFDTIHSVWVLSMESTLCKFFSRLCNGQGDFWVNPKQMKRSDLKYVKLIPGKGLSKNKPTCENAVSQTLYGSCTLRVMGSCLCSVFIFSNTLSVLFQLLAVFNSNFKWLTCMLFMILFAWFRLGSLGFPTGFPEIVFSSPISFHILGIDPGWSSRLYPGIYIGRPKQST